VRPHNFYLDEVTVELLRRMAEERAVSLAAVVRMAVREKAEREQAAALRERMNEGRKG
jgi:hypothetical protein